MTVEAKTSYYFTVDVVLDCPTDDTISSVKLDKHDHLEHLTLDPFVPSGVLDADNQPKMLNFAICASYEY